MITDIKPYVSSRIANREVAVKTGDTVTIQYRAASALTPLIDVYGPANSLKIAKRAMKEITIEATSGVSIYEYPVTFAAAWGTGDFTVVCSELTQGIMDTTTITVYSYDIESMAGDVATILGITTALGDLEDVAAKMNAQFSILEMALSNISAKLSASVEEAASGSADLESIHGNLVKLSGQIKEISEVKGLGLGLEDIYEVSEEKKDDIVYIKNKTQELKALMEVNQKMMDNVANEPVIQTWYEYGSIILKAIIINPSLKQGRDVPFKAYLPKEAKPEHILRRGDLNVAYDTQQGSYYVFATFKLKPKESKEIEIEMEDIWQIKEPKVERLRMEARKLFYTLRDTKFSNRARFLVMDIEDKLDRITQRQSVIPANPEVHISIYRENLKLFEEAELSLILLKSLISQVKAVPTEVTWKVIGVIVLFLGVLSLVFYVVWQRQMTLGEVPTFETQSEEEAENGEETEEQEIEDEERRTED